MTEYYHRLPLCGSSRAISLILKQCTTVETLSVLSPHPNVRRRMNDEEMVATFQKMGELPSMTRLELRYDPNYTSFYLPAAALTAVLRAAKHLTYLMLGGVWMSGNEAEIKALAEAFREHEFLNRIYFTNCRPTVGSAALWPILEALASNPNVQHVCLGYLSWLVNSPFHLCDKGSTWQSLRLIGTGIVRPDSFKRISQALETNHHLTEVLRISECPLPAGSGSALAKLLSTNKSLTDIYFEFMTPQELFPICRALYAKNRSLKRVHLLVYQPGSPKHQALLADVFARTLSRNDNIEHLTLHSPYSFITNLTLEYFLRLNRAGRRQLLQNSSSRSPASWVNALIANRNDLHVIHYILSLNPSLCQLTPGSSCKTKRRRKRRSDVILGDGKGPKQKKTTTK